MNIYHWRGPSSEYTSVGDLNILTQPTLRIPESCDLYHLSDSAFLVPLLLAVALGPQVLLSPSVSALPGEHQVSLTTVANVSGTRASWQVADVL